jgi:hypothetical protein
MTNFCASKVIEASAPQDKSTTRFQDSLDELLEVGFTIIPGPVPHDDLPRLQAAYDLAVASAESSDIHIGSTSTRVSDLVNRGPAFDDIYIYPPLIEACRLVIDQPFRLSAMHARTLHPGAKAQPMHVDFAADDRGWPMVGFILMVDDFREENGATRFVPGSHKWRDKDPVQAKAAGEVAAVGPAGWIIVYNGSILHEHGTNSSLSPRRSIQGAFIRRSEMPSIDPSRMKNETLQRISPLARYLLGVED